MLVYKDTWARNGSLWGWRWWDEHMAFMPNSRALSDKPRTVSTGPRPGHSRMKMSICTLGWGSGAQTWQKWPCPIPFWGHWQCHQTDSTLQDDMRELVPNRLQEAFNLKLSCLLSYVDMYIIICNWIKSSNDIVTCESICVWQFSITIKKDSTAWEVISSITIQSNSSDSCIVSCLIQEDQNLSSNDTEMKKTCKSIF